MFHPLILKSGGNAHPVQKRPTRQFFYSFDQYLILFQPIITIAPVRSIICPDSVAVGAETIADTLPLILTNVPETEIGPEESFLHGTTRHLYTHCCIDLTLPVV